ncbi:hypothetical protein B0H17DRAFT_1151466 [Mycena rosella]|uniref:Uncharacterized protein n=1 Tax=Mycena rosella TaxID=1033263 RepID=A0AAD7BL30_MYCRO|nr:hypothetical protein B0H17DRAFT_1151466 [Mycena rosella]
MFLAPDSSWGVTMQRSNLDSSLPVHNTTGNHSEIYSATFTVVPGAGENAYPTLLTLHPSEFDTLFGSHWGATINDATPAFALPPSPAIDSIDGWGAIRPPTPELRRRESAMWRNRFRLAAKEDERRHGSSDVLARPDITPSEFDTLFGSHWGLNPGIGNAGAEPQFPTSSHNLLPAPSILA